MCKEGMRGRKRQRGEGKGSVEGRRKGGRGGKEERRERRERREKHYIATLVRIAS